jgi:hypothetical protein
LWQAQIGTRILWGSATDGCQLYVASRKGFSDNTGRMVRRSKAGLTGNQKIYALTVLGK